MYHIRSGHRPLLQTPMQHTPCKWGTCKHVNHKDGQVVHSCRDDLKLLYKLMLPGPEAYVLKSERAKERASQKADPATDIFGLGSSPAARQRTRVLHRARQR